MVRQATARGWIALEVGGICDCSYPDSKTRRGRVIANGQICPTLTCEGSEIYRVETKYRIRKLTPRECWRLMDFTDEQFDKAQEVNSSTQLYKQAGNSIVVACLEAIFSQMGIGEKWNDRKQEEEE